MVIFEQKGPKMDEKEDLPYFFDKYCYLEFLKKFKNERLHCYSLSGQTLYLAKFLFLKLLLKILMSIQISKYFYMECFQKESSDYDVVRHVWKLQIDFPIMVGYGRGFSGMPKVNIKNKSL